jgi:hypothetical protein
MWNCERHNTHGEDEPCRACQNEITKLLHNVEHQTKKVSFYQGCCNDKNDLIDKQREALEKIASWAMKPNRQGREERDEAIEIARVALDT